MPPRSRRSRPPPAAASLASFQTFARYTLGALRDLTLGLTLISALSYLPGSVTHDWSAQALRALAIAHDIRVLLHDLILDSAAGAAALIRGLGPVPAPAPPVRAPTPAGGRTPGPVPALPPAELPRVAAGFSAAKRLLYDQVYADHRVSFYCGCAFDAQHRTDLSGCGLAALAGEKRAQRVEADHVFPAAQFGQARPCWRDPAAFPACAQSGARPPTRRQCCEKVDPLFAAAHNDLQNLVPAVGTINGQRSDYNWGLVSGGDQYGTCAIRIDAGTRRVQPPPAVRGDIARIMLYMRDTYSFNLSRQDTQLYAAWNNADPPDAWELERDRRIGRLQGRGNRYVEDYQRQ
jgi:deoxyribonuclease-1